MSYPCWVLILALIVPLTTEQTLYPRSSISKLHASLHTLQHPINCTSARVLVVQYSAESGINGFAAMFQFIAGALGVAYALNRTLIEVFSPTDPWLRSPPQYCGGSKLGCYLEPISSCAGVGWDVATIPTVALTLEGALSQASLPALRLSHLGTHHDLLFQATGGGHWPQWWDEGVGEHGCVYQGAPWGVGGQELEELGKEVEVMDLDDLMAAGAGAGAAAVGSGATLEVFISPPPATATATTASSPPPMTTSGSNGGGSLEDVKATVDGGAKTTTTSLPSGWTLGLEEAVGW